MPEVALTRRRLARLSPAVQATGMALSLLLFAHLDIRSCLPKGFWNPGDALSQRGTSVSRPDMLQGSAQRDRNPTETLAFGCRVRRIA